jgi:hypothetical protein
MIVADKRVLETSLASGMLQIQSNLVALYTSNLNAIAFISAVVGLLMWNGIEQTEWPENVHHPPFVKFMFYFLDISALMICFYVFSISTVYSIWGPVMAMNGNDATSVKLAVRLLKENQFQIFLLINVMFVFVFGATTFFLWSLIETVPAIICTFLCVAGMIILVTVGFRTVRIFDPDITLKQIIFPHLFTEKDENDDNIAMGFAVEDLKVGLFARCCATPPPPPPHVFACVCLTLMLDKYMGYTFCFHYFYFSCSRQLASCLPWARCRREANSRSASPPWRTGS